ncbi:hypothetical protein ACFOWE_22010 [Planomonospora corallina]|uniref:Uncharacterized protein n=1 Tax=Planomonospora corallina TaxID=1806052 RepID=A0ABV8ICW7_9ACTN
MASGDIWQQFGLVTWRAQRKRLQGAVSLGLSSAVIAAGMWWTGSVTPHIRWELDSFFLHAIVDENGLLSADVHISIDNEGMVPFTLTGISADMPGLRLLPDPGPEEPSEVTVAGGDVEALVRRVVITDCAAVPHEPQPVRVSYRSWTGSRTVEVVWDSWWLGGPGGRVPVAWQRGLAAEVCNDAVNPSL